MKKNTFNVFVLFFALALVACNDNNDKSGSANTRVEIRLTDAPAAYDAVNINVQSVSLNVDSKWIDIDLLHPDIYNLLDFQNGIDTLLAQKDIPSGLISQIRLNLGEAGNSIVKNGISYPLEIPSSAQSGLKLNLHYQLMPDIVYRLWIDFDASRSIVKTGSDKYILKPVIRTYSDAMGGTIKGYTLPLEANASVLAILGTDTLLAHPRSTDGYFLIGGLKPSPTWKVIVDANNAGAYKDSIMTNVPVANGIVTDLKQVVLHK